MSAIKHYLARSAMALMCLALLCILDQTGSTQQPGTTSPMFQQKIHVMLKGASMTAAFQALSKDTQISIVADGEPLLQKTDLNLDGTLREALDKVADTFDYTWAVSKGGVVLMSKRFKNPKERPQVNLPEMLGMTRDMIRALTAVDYDHDPSHWEPLVKEVAQTFTQQQLRVLDSGAKLRGSDLLPPQQQQLQQAILSKTFLATLDLWQGLLPNLENMPISHLQARTLDVTNVGANAPTHDYLYVFRRSNGQLRVFQFPHINYSFGNETFKTP